MEPTPEQSATTSAPLGSGTDTKDSLFSSRTTATERQWLRPSDSTGPSETVIDTGEVGNTSQGSTLLVPKTKYILLTVGAALVILCLIFGIVAVLCVWRSKSRKRRSTIRAKASNASDFVYNSVYTGVVANLKPDSTGYHSHWSLIHDGKDSTHLEMEPMHIYDEVSDTKNYYSIISSGPKGRASNIYEEAVQVHPKHVVIQNKFQRIREECQKTIEDSVKQSSVEETNLPNSSITTGRSKEVASAIYIEPEDIQSGKDYEDIYDNPTFEEEEEEKKEEEEEGEESADNVFCVYYSAPTRETQSTSVFISENEAYESSGVSEENTSGTSTDSVYYTNPTLISSEEFEIISNLAYKSTPNS